MYTCIRTYVYAHRAARSRALFVAGPAENTDLSPSASSPSTPTPLFWGFYTLSRAATTKPRASTMSDLPSPLHSRLHCRQDARFKDPDDKKRIKSKRRGRKSFDFSFRAPWDYYSESYLLVQEDLPQVSENLCLKATLSTAYKSLCHFRHLNRVCLM